MMLTTRNLTLIFVISAAICVLSFAASGKAIPEETKEKTIASIPSLTPEEMEEKWGIRPLSIRQTAAGNMLDFRYYVIDEQKAAPLFSPKIKPLLIDEDTGAVMAVPEVPKVGSMRSTRKPLKDRGYFILFANPHQHVKQGHKVTVTIGDYRAEHLVVE
jgi:hypothetical protein